MAICAESAVILRSDGRGFEIGGWMSCFFLKTDITL